MACCFDTGRQREFRLESRMTRTPKEVNRQDGESREFPPGGAPGTRGAPAGHERRSTLHSVDPRARKKRRIAQLPGREGKHVSEGGCVGYRR
jgi:hypothetical protein